MNNKPHPYSKHLITLKYMFSLTEFYVEISYEVKHGGTLILYQDLMDGEIYGSNSVAVKMDNADQMHDLFGYDKSITLKENLLKSLEKIVDDRRFIYGLPWVEQYGKNINEEEWEGLLNKFRTKTNSTFTSAFIEYMRKENLNPQPFDEEKGKWIARCVSGGNHPMMISAYFDEFGCGWCKRKGGKKELEEWIEEKKKKKYGIG